MSTGTVDPEGAGGIAFEAPPAAPLQAGEITGSEDAAGSAGSDLELVGRHQDIERRSERTPALAATGALTGGGAAASTTDDASRRDPAVDIVDDAPRWSFGGDVPGDASVFLATADGASDQAELPLAMDATPAPETRRPTPMFGPIGRSRSPFAVVLLSMVTLGVYSLVWHQRVNREMELFDPKLHARPRSSTLAVLIPWLIGLVVSVAGAVIVVTAQLGVRLPVDTHLTTMQAYWLLGGLAAVPYLTLLIPFSAVAVVMTLERLRAVEEHVGATTDKQIRPVAASLLLAIPVVGGLALLGIEQRRLDEVWRAVTPAGHFPS